MYSSASLLGSVCNLKTQDMVVTELCVLELLLQILLYSDFVFSVNSDVGNPKEEM